MRNDGVILTMFKASASSLLPLHWNTTRITPVHEKGATNLAENYQPVSMIGPINKLFSACMNMELEHVTELNDWRDRKSVV